MSRDREHLTDVLEAARLALSYVHDISVEDFLSNTQVQDAVVRRLEIIGEAARRVSAEGREEYPDLPWQDMIAVRNMLIHEYDGVDMRIVWDTVHRSLPDLIDRLARLLRK